MPVISTLDNIEVLIFMQDGVPLLLAIVGEWLNANFLGRWMGCDLTLCDFFLWSWLKEQVYSTKPTTLDELEGQIRQVMSSILQDFLVMPVDVVPSRQSSLSLEGWWRMLSPILNFKLDSMQYTSFSCSFIVRIIVWR